MSLLTDLAALITADKRGADELGVYIGNSREQTNELFSETQDIGLERKSEQISAVSGKLSEAQNSNLLASGHLEDALLLLNAAIHGHYGEGMKSLGEGDSGIVRTNTDGSQTLHGWYEGRDVSIRLMDTYEPVDFSDPLRSALGLPRTAPEETDTTGDERAGKFKSFARKLVRNAADIHGQFKESAKANVNTATAYEPQQHGLQETVGYTSHQSEETPGQDSIGVDADGLASVAVASIVAVDGFSRILRNPKRSGK